MRMPESRAVFVVDDEPSVRLVLSEALRDAGLLVQEFDGARAALRAVAEQPPAAVITDVRMPGMDGLQLLAELKLQRPALPVIVMSAYTDVGSTAAAFRGGAFDFLSKPFDLDAAVQLAQRALGSQDAAAAPIASPEPAEEPGLIGRSPAMQALYRAIGRLAQAPLSVLIRGETGTGKELVARALHRHSPRAERPFIALNTAAIPAELLESELFGHEAGAFTGAQRRQGGRFEQANGGTLFLDEIGDMPLGLQTRLLRVLAEGEFFRLGGRELIRVDVRVIAATHQDLDALVAQGRFRADLLHRLDVVRLQLPPLRERREDVAELAGHFLAQAAAAVGSSAKRFESGALVQLERYDWPGNVRELENLCWRLAALAPGESIGSEELAELWSGTSRPIEAPLATPASHDWERMLCQEVEQALGREGSYSHAEARERFDRVLLDAALSHAQGHRQQAAALLGLGRNTVTRKLGSSRARKQPRPPE
jgi:two-component system, NtrC family, nitrogen regulation response regulator GlnG